MAAEYEFGGEVAHLDRFGEFRDAVATTLRRMKQPQVFLPGILLLLLPQIAILGFAGSLLRMISEGRVDPSALKGGAYGSAVGLVAIGVLLCTPAAISGLAALAKRTPAPGAISPEDWAPTSARYWGHMPWSRS